MRLVEYPAEEYAGEVLPRTAAMWAGRRDAQTYVAHALEIARSGYGRRHYRTVALEDDGTRVASFKRYERGFLLAGARLRGVGFGAVYTPEEMRGRGYASVMLGMALDRARERGFDVGFLFSDIAPAFYEALGFVTLPSRELSLRADLLATTRTRVDRFDDEDWPAVRRAFARDQGRRAWGFARTPLVWEWVRMRMQHGSEHPVGAETNLVVRRGRSLAAYVFGVRAPERDAYVLDEFGYATDRDAELIVPLLRAAAGDLRRIIGWLPPLPMRDLLPRGSVRRRTDAVFMAAPLSAEGKQLVDAMRVASPGDPCWATDHI